MSDTPTTFELPRYRVSLTPVASTMRAKVESLEAVSRAYPQVDCPVEHAFYPGVYVRKMTIPAGVTLTGAVHRTEHVTELVEGRCLMTLGDDPQEYTAPYLMLTKAGSKRAISALETTVLRTIHLTNTTDLTALVEELTESTASELIGGAQNKQLLMSGIAALEQA